MRASWENTSKLNKPLRRFAARSKTWRRNSGSKHNGSATEPSESASKRSTLRVSTSSLRSYRRGSAARSLRDCKVSSDKAPVRFLSCCSPHPAYYSGYPFSIGLFDLVGVASAARSQHAKPHPCPSSRSSRETETGNLVFPTSREADFTGLGEPVPSADIRSSHI